MINIRLKINDEQEKKIKQSGLTAYAFAKLAIDEKLKGDDLQNRLDKFLEIQNDFMSETKKRELFFLNALEAVSGKLENLFAKNENYRADNGEVLQKIKADITAITKKIGA
ncbi:MAG: hypothetical protein RL154_931 [Pseudomonadota bacterium]|jgi:hypothetical protein